MISGGEVFRPGVDTDNFGVMSEKNTEAFTDTVDQLHGHYLPGTIREKVGTDIWNEYFKFTTIRNPWDLIVSFLHWKFGPNWPDIPGSNLLRVRSLRDVRRSLLRRQARRGFISGHPRKSVELVLKTEMFPYISEIPDFYFIDGLEYADYYIRYENLQHDFNHVCRLLKLPLESLPRTKNESRKKCDDHRDYYSNWSREYVARLCDKMIDAFGYRFDAT